MSFHTGRAWTGTAMENNCPCPKVPCGLVDLDNTSPDCTQHGMENAKTMRQGHRVEDCQRFMLAETLRKHRFIAAEARCICGWSGSYGPGTGHAVHVAEILTNLGYTRPVEVSL